MLHAGGQTRAIRVVREARKNNRPKKSGAINGRISGGLRARLDAISERHGVGDATMLEDALTALADFVEKSGRYERPMNMVSAKDLPDFDNFFQLNEARRAQEIVNRAKQLADPTRAVYVQERKKT